MSPIAHMRSDDYDEWEPLFRAYIEHGGSSIPDEQYRRTFDRLISPGNDLYGLVLREHDRIVGLAHFYAHQSTWTELQSMHLSDLFIVEHMRGQGHGRKLLLAVKEMAVELGCSRLKWITPHDSPARHLYDQFARSESAYYQIKFDGSKSDPEAGAALPLNE